MRCARWSDIEAHPAVRDTSIDGDYFGVGIRREGVGNDEAVGGTTSSTP